jgi:1,2-diacylglycerol 3-alpha-glucosyltransferase
MSGFSIAMVVACPFPANHGTPAAIREMSETLAEMGHSVHVVTYPLREEMPVRSVAIHRVRHVGKSREIVVGPSYQRMLFDALMVPKLCSIIKREKIDVIHAHNYEGALIGWAAKKITSRPLIYNAINTMMSELPSYGFIRPRALAVGVANGLDSVVPRVADFVVADTEELRFFILSKGVPPEKVEVVPSGVNVEMFEGGNGARIREKLEIGQRPLVIYTGTFDQFQGIDYLMKGFQIVHRAEPDAILLLLGSTVNPLHADKYRQMARELGFGGSFIIRTAGIDVLPDYLAAADEAVVPRPVSPGIPTKLLNYMAAGKAIVSFRGSASGLKDMVNALLIESDDWRKLGEAMLKLINDKPLAERLGAAAKACIKNTLDWKTIARRLEKIYSSLSKNGAARRFNS